MKYIKIYGVCVRTAFAQAVAYRADFILGSFITLLSNILFPLVTILIYENGAEFPGWNMWEVLLIQSIYSMATGISSMVLSSVVWVTMDHIREGSFETVLLKPIPPLFFIVASNFSVQSMGLFLGGLVMTIVAAAHTGISGIGAIGSFLLLFLAGLMVLCGMNLLMAAISFKWVGNSRIPEIFDSISNFGKYPLGIFPQTVQILAALVIPVAVIGFFPASALLGRLEGTAFLSLLPCVLFLGVGIWLYNKMIHLYEGVGG
ncbi:MAG: ABC-2 family transporter protein [Lachnospiraceae bacterium]|nr:ABC-2 family transporter protein [Lachnospiraceae bacterium]